MKWRITIIRPWPGVTNYDRKYLRRPMETYEAEGDSFTEARDNMDREQGLTHVDYMTWTSELVEPEARS